MRRGVPKSASAGMNTIKALERMVGMITGMVTLRMRLKPATPRFSLASSKEESMVLSAPDTYRYTMGNSLSVKTSSMPPKP